MKNNIGLVEYAKAQLGLPYWYGTYGQTATQALYDYKKKQYPSFYTARDFEKQYGKKVHDCVGLIKGYMWSLTPLSSPKYSATQDKNVSGMLKACSETGSIKSIPEVQGVLVFMGTSHIGVYIGNGEVIEARGHAYGVVKTKLANRKWDKWGKLSWIAYIDKPKPKVTVKQWQQAAQLDGFTFPRYGADGLWGSECESVAKKAICKKRLTYKYKNLTRIVQKIVGVTADGLFGSDTKKAVIKYQKANGLVADGEVGYNTWKKMLGVK